MYYMSLRGRMIRLVELAYQHEILKYMTHTSTRICKKYQHLVLYYRKRASSFLDVHTPYVICVYSVNLSSQKDLANNKDSVKQCAYASTYPYLPLGKHKVNLCSTSGLQHHHFSIIVLHTSYGQIDAC